MRATAYDYHALGSCLHWYDQANIALVQIALNEMPLLYILKAICSTREVFYKSDQDTVDCWCYYLFHFL